MEGLFFTVAFAFVLLIPVVIVVGGAIGLYALFAAFTYEKHRAVFVIGTGLCVVGLAMYAFSAWNQYVETGSICWGENVCIDSSDFGDKKVRVLSQ